MAAIGNVHNADYDIDSHRIKNLKENLDARISTEEGTALLEKAKDLKLVGLQTAVRARQAKAAAKAATPFEGGMEAYDKSVLAAHKDWAGKHGFAKADDAQ